MAAGYNLARFDLVSIRLAVACAQGGSLTAAARESHLVVTLTEGKNREVRRLCEAVGHEVTRLRRVQIGGLELGGLRPGTWRIVGDDELRAAFPHYTTPGLRRPE